MVLSVTTAVLDRPAFRTWIAVTERSGAPASELRNDSYAVGFIYTAAAMYAMALHPGLDKKVRVQASILVLGRILGVPQDEIFKHYNNKDNAAGIFAENDDFTRGKDAFLQPYKRIMETGDETLISLAAAKFAEYLVQTYYTPAD